jgi:hypothetical protein
MIWRSSSEHRQGGGGQPVVSHRSLQGGPGADRNGGQRPVGLQRANGEVQHFLRDLGFFVKVPPSWRELRARGRRLQGTSVAREAVAQRLGGWS